MNKKLHRGIAIIEVVAACGLLLALMALVAGIFALSYRGSRAAERHSWALTEASNCLERLSALDWSELLPQRAASESLSPTAQQMLGSTAKLTARIEDAAADPAARKIVVEVRWTNDGRPAPVVRLVTWRYRMQIPSAAGTAP